MGDRCFFNIAEDLVIDVLSRLPLKTLARVKRVSKQWLYLISDIITLPKVPKLLISNRWEEKRCLFHSIDQENRHETVCSPIDNIVALSSCNGLVLIQIDADLLVWNPLTKFFRKVLTYDDLNVRDYGISLPDLCFDSANDEYKVLLFTAPHGYSYFSEDAYFYQVEFYVATCGTSSWGKIKVPNYIDFVLQGPFFKGYRHWICKRDLSECDEYLECDGYLARNHIVYFDPQTNEFVDIPIPQPKPNNEDRIILGLGVLDGCLCMTRGDNIGIFSGDDIEFFVMKEHGNGKSWNVMFSIPTNLPGFSVSHYNVMKPLFKTKEGELLLSCHEDYYGTWSVIGYDVDSNTGRHITDARHFNPTCQAIMYEESWLSPTGYNWEHFLKSNIHLPGVLHSRSKQEKTEGGEIEGTTKQNAVTNISTCRAIHENDEYSPELVSSIEEEFFVAEEEKVQKDEKKVSSYQNHNPSL